jgi:D-3-phosphoglycerate dehydrogenase
LKVLICDSIDPEGIKILSSKGFEVHNESGIDKAKLALVLPDYDIVVVRGRTKIDGPLIQNAKKLRLIARAGVGLDNIDLETAKRAGIPVVNTPSAPSTSVAELTVGLMLCLLRKIPYADNAMKNGRWVKNELMGEELQGKQVGVIGRAGRIGTEVSRILTVGFQADVIGYDVIKPRGIPGLSYELADTVEELLARSDIVTVHVPYTPQTHHLLNETRLKQMKKGSYLVNTARGDIVDGQALLKLLKEGYLSGAALDVFHIEPPVDEWEKAIVNLPNGTSVVTCHIGAETKQAQRRASIELAQKIILETNKIAPSIVRTD